METTSRKYLTFADKVKLLKKFETSTVSKKEFARNEGIPFSSFRGFLKNKDQLLQDMGRSDSISRKRKLEGRHGELEEAVLFINLHRY